jgi:thymidylate kinase
VIFIFDGLSCVGKTTLVSHLSKIFDDSYVIAELNPELKQLECEDMWFYLFQDLAKVFSLVNSSEKHIFVDRCFFSTVCYRRMPADDQEAILTFFMSRIADNRHRICFVLVRDDPKVSLARHRKLRVSRNNAWEDLAERVLIQKRLTQVYQTVSDRYGFSVECLNGRDGIQSLIGDAEAMVQRYKS